jgi:alkaline phosphatase D
MKMLLKISYSLVLILFISCAAPKAKHTKKPLDFTIAFGSCNRQNMENILWKEIKKNKPNFWIWGGDNAYSNTDEIDKLRMDYETLKTKGKFRVNK